jgi:DMSO/TMAO reductase YedYZ molybdopterin-dependent catalytic subunit
VADAETERVPPGQTVTRLFPVLHVGAVPTINRTTWRFRVFGLVAEPLEWDWETFRQLPNARVRADIHCVTGWSKLDTEWEGVPTQEVWARIAPRAEVVQVIVHAAGGYTVNLSVSDFLQPPALFAWAYQGAPLPAEHGGPVRLVVPHRYFWKSAKWVTGIELVDDDRLGYWEERGYHPRGDPWREERYW